MDSKYSNLDIDELGSIFSDYHKDVHGFRPRSVDFQNRQAIIAALEQLDAYMAAMRSTFEGREQLREQGWVEQETDPELKKKAFLFAKERDQLRAIEDQKMGYIGFGERFNESDRYK